MGFNDGIVGIADVVIGNYDYPLSLLFICTKRAFNQTFPDIDTSSTDKFSKRSGTIIIVRGGGEGWYVTNSKSNKQKAETTMGPYMMETVVSFTNYFDIEIGELAGKITDSGLIDILDI